MSNYSSSRSLNLKREYIKPVKASVTQRGFASQTALATELGLSRDVISRFLNGKPVDRLNAEEICDKLVWDIKEVTFFATPVTKQPKIDWGEAAESPGSFEREEELNTLEEWIVKENYRIVSIEGMAGMGKTNLSYELGKRIANYFDYVIWRSMDQYQSVDELLDDWLSFFYEQSEIDGVTKIKHKFLKLKPKLESDRCLLIVSNVDFGLDKFPCDQNYEGLLKWIANKQDKSYLLITSKVTPDVIMQLERDNPLVRRLEIKSLSVQAIKNIFSSVGSFSALEEDWSKLKETYHGNPFVVKNVAFNIEHNFDSNITNFIEFSDFVFNGIEQFIEDQLNTLSETQKEVMYWIAIYRHPISLFELRDILSGLFSDQLLTLIKQLKSRFLLYNIEEGILIQSPMIREYIIKQLINKMAEEIVKNELFLLNRFPLLLTTAQSKIRQDQEKFLINPMITQLKRKKYTELTLKTHLKNLLSQCQGSQSCEYGSGSRNIPNIQGNKSYGYASGNIVNLLCQLQPNFNEENFSHLVLRNTNFSDHTLHNSNFSHADLSNSIFINGFSNILSVAFSPDGKWLASGDTNNKIYLWQVTENRPILHQIITSHNFWVRTLAFSPDSKIIASSGEDGNIYLREVETGKLITQFSGHIDKVRDIKFSGDSKLLASSSDDRTIRLWDVERKQMITVLKHHQNKVRCVVFSSDQQTLISASEDNQICRWELSNYSLINSFFLKENQEYLLRGIALSPDGKTLASGSDDGVIRFWNVETGTFSKSLGQIHHNWIRSLAFSPDGDKIASGSEDGRMCITDTRTGQRLQTLRDNNGRIWSIAFHPHRPWLVSGNYQLEVTLWNVESGERLHSFKGYSQQTRPITFSPDGTTLATGNNQAIVTLKDSSTGTVQTKLETNGGNIWSLAYSPDGTILVGGGEDTKLYIWDILRQRLLKDLSEHKNWIRGVAYSSDGKFIATGSDDKTVKLWDAYTYKCLDTFEGHSDWIRSICFHPTKPLLASGSDDGTIKFWDISNPNNPKKTEKLKHILPTNQGQIWTIAISPDGNLLASGSNDNTVYLWNFNDLITDLTTKPRPIVLQQHRGWISSVAFSPDNQWLATGSYDTTIRLWELSSGDYECKFILQGHSDAVISLAFHPDQSILASSSKDGSIKRWDLNTKDCLPTWPSNRPYEGMKITGVTGLTAAEKEDLKSLGAVEESPITV